MWCERYANKCKHASQPHLAPFTWQKSHLSGGNSRIGEIFCANTHTRTHTTERRVRHIRYVCRPMFDDGGCGDGDGDDGDNNDDAFIADTAVIELDFENVHPISVLPGGQAGKQAAH